MAIGADAAKNKSDTAHLADACFIFHAKHINTIDDFLLYPLEVCAGLPHPQCEIDNIIWKDLFHAHPWRQSQRCRIDQ